VYAADTNHLLLPVDSFNVTLTVRRTAGSVLSRAGRAGGNTVNWLVGALAALGGAGFLTMVRGWWRERRTAAAGKPVHRPRRGPDSPRRPKDQAPGATRHKAAS
jgi:hypothetical protein